MKKQWWLLLLGVLIVTAGKGVLTSELVISKIANAIATAEGYFVVGSRPNRNNNPGDLKTDITGTGIGKDNGDFVIYATPEDGWDALKHQVRLMFSGSHIYTSTMTIAEIGLHYAENDVNWIENVAAELGVTPDTPLNQVI